MSQPDYPWYATIDGDDIQQGDIIEACPVFQPDMAIIKGDVEEAILDAAERDVIVMSQSCDMIKGHEKVDFVLLCAIWNRSEINTGHLATESGLEDARRGNLPGFHLVAACDIVGYERELRVVDFRRVYTLPIAFLREMAATTDARLRLLPPYREHLSQAFARFFMRVGLPVDIPPFK